jgi:hypothetical protein
MVFWRDGLPRSKETLQRFRDLSFIRLQQLSGLHNIYYLLLFLFMSDADPVRTYADKVPSTGENP